jgi:alanine-glyoxylate transaminase / serine-glyoxylate transaminase / serine-pyruvate transaminase
VAVTRGRQLFQNPGPTNMPERVLRAMGRAPIDYTGDEFRTILAECGEGLRRVFNTEQAVLTYASSGHGAWEAAVANICSPGDQVLVIASGFFSTGWGKFAAAMGLKVETLDSDWRTGADVAALELRLKEDRGHGIRAVMLVHNETSTGVANRCTEVRRAIDNAGHPALFLVDVISSLGCFEVAMDDWRADVVIGGSQKGLMLPVGMSFTGVSAKALALVESARMPRAYWDWRRLLTGTRQTGFHGTAPVHFFFALQEALRMLEEEGLEQVYARHHRLAEATRRAVRVWQRNDGPEIYASNPRTQSDSVTAVLVPEGHDAEEIRRICLARFNVSLGPGLEPLKGRLFRIGHMGDLNEAMIIGTLGAVEMAMQMAGMPHGKGGVAAAIDYLASVGSSDGHPASGHFDSPPIEIRVNGSDRSVGVAV